MGFSKNGGMGWWQAIGLLAALAAASGLLAQERAGPGADAWLGLPAPVALAHNPPTPEKIALGRALFMDARLSADGSTSCASCHQPERAFTDGRARAQGIHAGLGTRNTPSLLNVGFAQSLFWDGRRSSLEAQAADPLLDAREHGLANEAAVLRLLREHHAAGFRTVFGVKPQDIAMTHFAMAVASFERSLLAGNSAFDRHAYAGDATALSASAQRGLVLFKGEAQCASCHTIGPKSALFTDDKFHSVGVGLRRVEDQLPALTMRLARASAEGQAVPLDTDMAELGRFFVTLRPEDLGKFRTPGLRNVALTAPYMHDGSVATLEEAIDLEIYYRGATQGRPLLLTPTDRADLLAFLHALTSQHLEPGGPATPATTP